MSQFDQALKNDTKDNTIVIELNNEEPAKNITQQTELEKINENQDIIVESIHLHDEEKIPDFQIEEEPTKLEKENDEINISYHYEEDQKPKIKEKEYGD